MLKLLMVVMPAALISVVVLGFIVERSRLSTSTGALVIIVYGIAMCILIGLTPVIGEYAGLL